MRFPRIYYGWLMLGVVSLTEIISWGILYYAFSVFIAPMETELGWSRAALSAGFSLSLLSSGLASVPIGRWLDRHGARGLMTLGSILGTLMMLAWSQVMQLWLFYLIMILSGLAAAAVQYEPAFVMATVWFRRQRGRALTVLTFFGAWASFIFIPLSDWLLRQLGWRAALVALAAILALTILPHAIVVRRRPQDLGLFPDGDPAPVTDTGTTLHAPLSGMTVRAALHDLGFWWLTLAFATSQFAVIVVVVHLIPYLLDQGHSAEFAATVAGLYGLMSLIGRVVLGPLADRLPRRVLTGSLMVMQLLGLLVLASIPTTAGALIFITLFGIGSGTLTIMRPALLAERYGAAHYGSISGAQNLGITLARALAPVVAGAVAVLIGGYSLLMFSLAMLLAIGTALILAVRESKLT